MSLPKLCFHIEQRVHKNKYNERQLPFSPLAKADASCQHELLKILFALIHRDNDGKVLVYVQSHFPQQFDNSW